MPQPGRPRWIHLPSTLLSVTVLVLYLSTAACSFSRGTLGDAFKPEDVAAVKKGSSTRADVLSILGAPDRVLQMNGQEVFQYYRYDAKAGSLLLILVNFSRLNIKSDDLYVWFSRDGIVDEIIYGRRTDRMKFQFWPFSEEPPRE